MRRERSLRRPGSFWDGNPGLAWNHLLEVDGKFISALSRRRIDPLDSPYSRIVVPTEC
ncbi:MAG: hypothetical protein AAGJ40_06410 [Planctomycetota bacterium]